MGQFHESTSTKIATILSIGTANPPECVFQADFADEYFRLNGCENVVLQSKMNRICDKSMIRKRQFGHVFKSNHGGEPNLLGETFKSLDSRMAIDTVEIPKLGAMAAEKAINEWGQPKSRITHLLVHSTSGIKMPGIDFEIMKILELQPSVKRCMLYFYGCMAGVTTLRVAKDIAENNAGSRVLVICSEVLLNALQKPLDTNLVVPAIFGEGAAAVIIGADPDLSVENPLFQIISADQTVIPGTEHFITADIREAGIVSNLSKDIAKMVATNIEPNLAKAVSKIGVEKWDELFWIVHPGGAKVVNYIETELKLEEEKLGASRRVLREFGNMSSPTVFFIMDEMRKNSVAQGQATTGEGLEWGVLFGFGPGITVETIVLRSFPITATP